MPRRRPGAVRADQPSRDRIGQSSSLIRGAGRGPWAKIDRVQARRVIWGILVTYPLHRYRSFLRQPGRWLYVQWTDSNVDPQDARDELERVMTVLPPRTRAELRRIVAPLDAEFRRRTLPDPHAASNEWRAAAWWRQRMYETPQDRPPTESEWRAAEQ